MREKMGVWPPLRRKHGKSFIWQEQMNTAKKRFLAPPLALKYCTVSEICWEKHPWEDTLNICHERGGILPPWAEAWIALYAIWAFFHTACICFPPVALAHMLKTSITLGTGKAIKCLVFPLPQVWCFGAKGLTCTPPSAHLSSKSALSSLKFNLSWIIHAQCISDYYIIDQPSQTMLLESSRERRPALHTAPLWSTGGAQTLAQDNTNCCLHPENRTKYPAPLPKDLSVWLCSSPKRTVW